MGNDQFPPVKLQTPLALGKFLGSNPAWVIGLIVLTFRQQIHVLIRVDEAAS